MLGGICDELVGILELTQAVGSTLGCTGSKQQPNIRFFHLPPFPLFSGTVELLALLLKDLHRTELACSSCSGIAQSTRLLADLLMPL